VGRIGSEFQVFKQPRTGELTYYLDGRPLYRTVSHPEGPSSVPWLVVRGRSVCLAEGHPGGASDRPLYKIRHLWKRDAKTTIHPGAGMTISAASEWSPTTQNVSASSYGPT
jgi:hypothetical protein